MIGKSIINRFILPISVPIMVLIFFSCQGDFINQIQSKSIDIDKLDSLYDAALCNAEKEFFSLSNRDIEAIMKEFPIPDSLFMATVYADYAYNLYFLSQRDSSIYYALEGERMVPKRKINGSIHLKLQLQKGLCLSFNTPNYQSEDIFLKVLESAQNLKDSTLIIRTLAALGSCYVRRKDYEEALCYYGQIIDNFQRTSQNQKMYDKVLRNWLGVMAYYGEKDIAKRYWEDIIAKYQYTTDSSRMSLAYYNLSLANLSLEEYKSVLTNCQKSLDWLGLQPDTEILQGIYYNQQKSYYALGDLDSAYRSQTLMSQLIETNISNKTEKEVIEILKKYALTKTEQELESEKSQRLEAELSEKSIRGWLFGFLGLSTFIGLLSYTYFSRYRLNKENELLKIKKSQLEESNKLQTLQNEIQSKILNATIDGKESERQKISEILHDSVSASLSAANLQLQANKLVNKISTPELEKAQAIINEASERIRDLSHELVSPVLVNFGLHIAIRELCEKCSNSLITFEAYDEGYTKRLPLAMEMKIFSMIEELANNIMKHSKATHATICIKKTADSFNISVVDDGIGFHISDIKNGLGLGQVEARVRHLGGDLNVYTHHGTRVNISFPLT